MTDTYTSETIEERYRAITYATACEGDFYKEIDVALDKNATDAQKAIVSGEHKAVYALEGPLWVKGVPEPKRNQILGEMSHVHLQALEVKAEVLVNNNPEAINGLAKKFKQWSRAAKDGSIESLAKVYESENAPTLKRVAQLAASL